MDEQLEPPRRGIEVVDSGTHLIDEETDAEEKPSQTPHLRLQTGRDQLRTPSPQRGEPQPPSTPGGLPIPKTVVEKVDPKSPSHGDVPGTAAFEMRKMDAEPDDIREAPEITRTTLEGLPTPVLNRYPEEQAQPESEVESPASEHDRDKTAAMETPSAANEDAESPRDVDGGEDNTDNAAKEVDDDDDGFGDDFDEFEEGADDDFGAFDEASIEPQNEEVVPSPAQAPREPLTNSYGLPLLDYAGLDNADDIAAACQPYLEKMFPSLTLNYDDNEELGEINPAFLSERSQSLWAQLVAPPPLQPPDWVRSRIRRLFLVSLGVPVDLDEILPASKQKKLVLPSISTDHMLRKGSATPANGSSTPTTGADGSPKSSRRHREAGGKLDLDVNSARLVCTITETALASLTKEELRAHIARLQELTQQASKALESWLLQKDRALGDKQAFEEVIENLVKHAQKVRK